FVVRSQSIHRIQESQALLGYQLWATVQQHLMPPASKPHRRGDST
ncbi:MAG: phosphoheptose isomerase, partial [Actinomycetota bacterium]|nr:phosphoheptose isomerase [Actinomycetota bacterium]